MITKESFIDFIKNYKVFNEAVGRIGVAISGKDYCCDIYESDWYNSVGLMLDIFIDSNFTTDGIDLINAYLFENIPLIVYEDENLFEKEKEIVIDSLDKLWNYIESNNFIKTNE